MGSTSKIDLLLEKIIYLIFKLFFYKKMVLRNRSNLAAGSLSCVFLALMALTESAVSVREQLYVFTSGSLSRTGLKCLEAGKY